MRVERPQLNQRVLFIQKQSQKTSWPCFILTFVDYLKCYKENKMLMRACHHKGY